MNFHDDNLEPEENAWSTALTAIPNPTSGTSGNQEAATIPVVSAQSTPPNNNSQTPPSTTPPLALQQQQQAEEEERGTPTVSAHIRGLTSTLSGRRQRHEINVQDASQQHRPNYPHSRQTELTSSQASLGTPTALGPRRSSNSSRIVQSPKLASYRQQGIDEDVQPRTRVFQSDSSRNNPGFASGFDGAVAGAPNDGDDDGDMDMPPSESFLIEIPSRKQRDKAASPLRHPPLHISRHQAISWGNPPQQSPSPHRDDDENAKEQGPTGFVRRAARAVHTRIQEISDQTADVRGVGSPMPPPRHSSRDVYGDGRAFSVSGNASAAWPRRGSRQQRSRTTQPSALSYRERALRAWRDSRHQDEFFCRVYAYFAGKGALAIVLSRVLQLVTLAFVVALSTFVFGCIDHAKVRKQRSLSEVVVPQCTSRFSWTTSSVLYCFAAFWLAQMIRAAMDVPSLLEIRAFYTEVLGITPADISTAAWHEVVSRMVKLRDAEIREYRGLTKSRILGYRLTADAIVNRIMRRENYMIALFNKDVLNISIPGLGRQQVLTKALEWNLSFCLMSYLFDERGQLRHRFLKESNREILTKGLRRRFQFMAAINMMFAPFIVVFLVLYTFLRYFDELYHEPGTIMSRAFTPYAKYKFRNFNEVPHSFHRRLSSAHPKATLYLSQFRNDALITVARFVSFIAGSFTALLLLLTVFDNELSLEFEITPHRTVLFYIGLFSAILATSRGMIPTDEQEYLHPAWIIRDALEDLQYMEPGWRGKLDTTQVRREFEALFSYKLLIFAHELLGVLTAPFVMLISLPKCAESVVDFFREFTVHQGGLGYVCSFATFDFEKHGNVQFSAPTRAAGEHFASKHGKMEQSFLAFKTDYPEWQPRDQAASIYLQRAQNAQQDLWRVGSTTSGATGWQGRLLQQQRMAGSIFPTGASLYRPGQVPGDVLRTVPESPAANMAAARSQYAFQPPGFTSPSAAANANSQQSMASQAMLPFGPTLGEHHDGLAANRASAKGKGRLAYVEQQSELPHTERLALSSLPLVASAEMVGNSMELSATGTRMRMAPSAGIFSIVNQLYEQQPR
ncbi:autophagy protein atg9 [Coemansia sp. RSA 485]|nr:autophagy protein atg9 [Coemansia sp. RSA 485]